MSTGLKANVDGSAALQVGGTDYLTVTSGGNTTFTQAANLPNTFGFKNRIINGAMVIDQRNAGASVTPTANTYALDRWFVQLTQASKFSIQQSSTAPTGFNNSVIVTSASAYSVLSTDTFNFQQRIEGFNFSDLGWGTATAQTVTLSFQVRSSLTGTFGGSLRNSAANRSYPFTYTINSANTWETKSVTIAGDTSGTWIGATNGIGVIVTFDLGSGSTYSGTAGAWAAGNFISATGATSVVGTNGATFYITGVQLEKGSTATSFDYRPYSTELQLAQRYLPAFNSTGTVSVIGGGYASATNSVNLVVPFLTQTRVAPTGVSVSSASHISWSSTATNTVSAVSFNAASNTEGVVTLTATATSGQGGVAFFNNTSGQLLFNGCEL